MPWHCHCQQYVFALIRDDTKLMHRHEHTRMASRLKFDTVCTKMAMIEALSCGSMLSMLTERVAHIIAANRPRRHTHTLEHPFHSQHKLNVSQHFRSLEMYNRFKQNFC